MRIIQGAVFGLAQMILGSTLVLDLTETRKRTEAEHAYAWFQRFALSLGPLAGLLITTYLNTDWVLFVPMGLTALAFILVSLLRVPFRAPLRPKVISLDRFWLPQGLRFFLNLLPVATAMGLLMAVNASFEFYGFIMLGFLLSLIAHRIVFNTADLRAEVVSGLILIGAAMLLHITHSPSLVNYGASLMTGLGLGLVAPRFLLYFIKVSEHCQRSTAQTTFMLCWEFGICLGFFIGFSLIGYDTRIAYSIGLGCCIIA